MTTEQTAWLTWDVSEFEHEEEAEIEWGFICETLTKWIEEQDCNERFWIDGRNMGWRNQSGSTQIDAEDGETLLRGFLPRTSDFSFRIFKEDHVLNVTVYHHDSPTGEFYDVVGCRWKELDAVPEKYREKFDDPQSPICPYCGEEDAEGEEIVINNDGDPTVRCYCHACNALWYNVYELSRLVDANDEKDSE